MTSITQLVADVEKSEPYQSWRKEWPQHAFLASIFAAVEDEKPIIWNVNYFSPGTEKTTTFVCGDGVERGNDSTMTGDAPKPLDASEANVPFPQVLETASEGLDEHYPNHTYAKLFATLHQNEGMAVWNITFLTAQAKTITFRLKAGDGSVLSHKSYSINDFAAFVPKDTKQ